MLPIQRWLNNPRINVHRIYGSLIKTALSDWSESKIFLALDTSLFWDEYCLVCLSVIHRGRALPHEHSSKTRLASLACFAGCVWRVIKHESASVSFADYREMIKQAQTRLPESVKVILLADRGFIHTELMTMLTTQLGWNYRIRIKSNTWIWRGNWCQPKNFHFHLGEAICLHNVQIHKSEFYGKVHVILGRNSVNGELWAMRTRMRSSRRLTTICANALRDEKTTLQTFAEYGLRFDIEENFLDDQSAGWNVQRSMIGDVCALSRLWFILAVATLYVSAQGVEVESTGKRRWVDTHWFRGQRVRADRRKTTRGHSPSRYFRIGWDWVKAALINGWKLLHGVTFSGNQDPSPAMASRSQHQKRAYQLEFKVLTYSYNIS